ncbi:MAG: LUD domain-containing protein [Chloroflexi bacterium]|nr:LUD domain-containing protein [Chloroflexota bacterium]MBI3339063.1 LUD domain-containing protein [Chloroflexota bacterium]
MTPRRFKKRIHTSIANESLQAALDANALRRVQGRIAAFASLPDWKERRQRAHAVRAEVIAHLDSYLDQFIANAEKNGIIVHRAKDAAEAVKIVLGIAKSSPQSQGEEQKETRVHPRSSASHILIAKSKSMLSEEINLNHALEKAGHRAVETDLGEYIVQLRGEKPAHIITPAVHLRRADVGQLFHEKLGIHYTEDIPTLTNTARKVLREVFLTADIGISGVNFGVAETGTLCIVTNEGNGRMVTTMPPVHIALMGMERLVPTLDDLALMLSLLPRSATGQKLSVYTQLIHSPRRAGETDGAQERHLVIIDNGRSRLRNSPLHEALYCIRCGACLNACPVFRELGGHAYVGSDGSIAPYPGPIGSVVSPGLLGENFVHLAQASSLCGACKDACPVDIDLPKLLTRVRAGKAPATSGNGLSPLSKFGLQIYSRIARNPKLFSVSQKFAALTTFLVSPFSQWIHLPAFTGWGYSRDFPRPAVSPFRERFHRDPQRAKGLGAKSAKVFSEKKEKIKEPDLPAMPTVNLVERFSEELTALGGKVYRVSQAELNNRLVDFLKERNIEAVLMWDQVKGVDEVHLTEAGLRAVRSVDPSLKAGITGVASAIAETGTLVVPSGKGQMLSASLLPEIHIAIVQSSQIVLSLEEGLRCDEVRAAASVALVSGPSRTADIEMTLTIGVHGPGELHVFLVDG